MERVRKAALPVDADVWAALTALADPVRFRIFLLLRQREQCVCHLTEGLGLSQGTVSHHMRLLKRAGLVEDRNDPRDARWVYYRLNPARLARLRQTIDSVFGEPGADTPLADCQRRGEQRIRNSEGEV